MKKLFFLFLFSSIIFSGCTKIVSQEKRVDYFGSVGRDVTTRSGSSAGYYSIEGFGLDFEFGTGNFWYDEGYRIIQSGKKYHLSSGAIKENDYRIELHHITGDSTYNYVKNLLTTTAKNPNNCDIVMSTGDESSTTIANRFFKIELLPDNFIIGENGPRLKLLRPEEQKYADKELTDDFSRSPSNFDRSMINYRTQSDCGPYAYTERIGTSKAISPSIFEVINSYGTKLVITDTYVDPVPFDVYSLKIVQ